jgi:hypothetical protein
MLTWLDDFDHNALKTIVPRARNAYLEFCRQIVARRDLAEITIQVKSSPALLIRKIKHLTEQFPYISRLVQISNERVRHTSGFFTATKFNFRNAP